MKGAVYALEQCGLLITGAVTLMDQKLYSSAVVLAAFAREEMGRSIILTNFFDEITKNKKDVTIQDIKRACEDHITKQKWGQLSTSFRFQNDSQAGKLMLRRMELLRLGQQFSKEYTEVEIKAAELMERVRKRTPSDRHKARTQALYVEPDQSGLGWNIPKDITPEFARDFVIDAANDYSSARQHINTESSGDATEFIKQVRKWKSRPEIPLPIWPKWPN